MTNTDCAAADELSSLTLPLQGGPTRNEWRPVSSLPTFYTLQIRLRQQTRGGHHKKNARLLSLGSASIVW
ncbi:hypothetical protein SRHO_G00284920 [Serrasalmus rhombeus]